jgi:restriction system protein
VVWSRSSTYSPDGGLPADPALRPTHAAGPSARSREDLGYAGADRTCCRRSEPDPSRRDQEIPSGGTKLIASRVHWAKTYLKQAGLLEQPKRGKVQISSAGREVLRSKPGRIDVQLLQQFPAFQGFMARTKTEEKVVGAVSSVALTAVASTPEEQLEAASGALNESLRDALLARVLETSPASFEKLIIDLLLAMGYGGSRSDAGEQLGRTGDGGVDGVIREDRLGLDRVYLQAKRYKPGNSVGSEAVQAFIGALVGRGSQKGVLITTSTFTRGALDAANQTGGLRLVLIDGEMLNKLMIQFNVAVRVARTVEIKRIVRIGWRPRGHDNLSPGKPHPRRGKPAARPRAPSPVRWRSRAEPARAAVSLP